MKSSRVRLITKALLIAIVLFVVYQIGCTHYRWAEKEMTWSCKPPEALRVPGNPGILFGVPTLELRFKQDPASIEYMTGPTAEKLCEDLSQRSKKALRVRFELRGSDFHGLVGYNIVSIDGKKIGYQIGDGGSSAWSGDGGVRSPHPFSNAFRLYLFQKER
jgi:hypothetical protein